jgi:hypothetical protein
MLDSGHFRILLFVYSKLLSKPHLVSEALMRPACKYQHGKMPTSTTHRVNLGCRLAHVAIEPPTWSRPPGRHMIDKYRKCSTGLAKPQRVGGPCLAFLAAKRRMSAVGNDRSIIPGIGTGGLFTVPAITSKETDCHMSLELFWAR